MSESKRIEEGSLDLTGATIQEFTSQGQSAPSIELPNQDAEYVNHIALDIGGSLIKLVYFSPDPVEPSSSTTPTSSGSNQNNASNSLSNGRGGRLHFVKFETSRVEDAIAFIEAKGLHRFRGKDGQKEMRVISTGGGSYRYADLFKQKLGVVLEREDEISCLVSGCNFLLKAIHHEAFTFENSATTFVPTDDDTDLYPYLLVNIGSGVGVVKVERDGQYERVSGTSLGGGTFWGLARLLTKLKDFDEILELSMKGNNANVDMLVGDIYGGRDYSTIGLSATTIASSFGKVIGQDKDLEDYNPADISMALCRMISYNIGQLAYMNAMKHNIKRIFFGGFFIRGHPYTMDTISYAIRFWSKGEMAATFLRHEGFLGAVGAFLKVHPMSLPGAGKGSASAAQPRKVRARFVERFSMGAPFAGGEVVGPAISDLDQKVSWVEKFLEVGAPALQAARIEHEQLSSLGQQRQQAQLTALGGGGGSSGSDVLSPAVSMGGSTGEAAHFCRGQAAGSSVEGSSLGMKSASGSPSAHTPAPTPVLSDQPIGRASHASGGAVDLLSPSHGFYIRSAGGESAVRMALHVGVLHYTPSLEPFPLLANPGSYEPNTLDINTDEEAYLWWLKVLEDQIPTVMEKAVASEGGGEPATRRAVAFGRSFAAHMNKLRTEPGAYGRLGLSELFEMREECLREFGFEDVYRLDKERENNAALSVLSDLLCELDAMPFEERLLSVIEGSLASNIFDWGARACVALYHDGTILDIYRSARQNLGKRPWAVDNFDAFASRLLSAKKGGRTPYRRAMMFVDNAGADIVLGMLPLARELLKLGCEVVLVANTLPAINDITLPELRSLLTAAGQHCPVLREAREAAEKVENIMDGRVPPFPGMKKSPSSNTLVMSSSYHHHGALGGASTTAGHDRRLSTSSHSRSSSQAGPSAATSPSARVSSEGQVTRDSQGLQASADAFHVGGRSQPGPEVYYQVDNMIGPKLYIVASGQGSPCMDFRRVPDVLAEACIGTDLLVIEGMGRAIHTNFRSRFKCDTLKLAMIKTEWLAKKLFGGSLYDCVCAFEDGVVATNM